MLILQILFIFHIIKQRNCLNILEDNIILNNNINDNNLIITPGIIETKYLYKRVTPFTLFFSNNVNYTYDLIINFHSINCLIDINIYNKSNKSDIGKALPNLIGHDKDTFSLRINKKEINNTLINIEPLNNDFFYNYNRTCPLIINSIKISNSFILSANEKEPIYLNFNESFKNLNISYQLKDNTDYSFVALLFSYPENAYFEVTVSDENNKKLKWKTLNISNSDNIFLTTELENIKELLINITYHPKNINSKSQALLKLEIKTDISPPTILEKNYINKGLITSNLEYKHFYFEVFKGEGGEIILHDKRQSGILIGSIIPKESFINKINNPNIYPKFNSTNQGNALNYDKHLLKLYFNFDDTKKCDKGCYILISYYHEKFSTKNNVIVGFEFTLLSRIWDDKEFQSQIINIPLNEYVFGYFEDKSVKEHYYSIYISDEIDGINIQIQGENIKGFYGNDKRKINENLMWYNVYDLNISNYKDIIYINTKNFKNDYISFLMKPEENSFSYYYFRILLLNKTSEMMLPLDSNMGNNCFSSNSQCYFLLKNDYNIFSLNLTIFISNPINYFTIYSMNIDNIYTFNFNYYFERTQNRDYSGFGENENQYINIENDNNSDYVLIIIFINQIIINNILSTFSDAKKEIIPNIYSSKIFKLDYNNKKAHLSLKDNFKIIFCSFYGEGIVNWSDYFKNQLFSQNMLGQYYKIPVKDNITDINFIDKENFVFYIKISNLEVNNRFNLRETLNDFIKNESFPLYYIIYMENRDNEDIDINFKIINLNDKITEKDTKFEIEGAIINRYEYEKIKSKGKQLEHSIKGEYDVCTKLGFLSFPIKNNNKEKILDDDENNIILIKINEISDYININTFIQIFATKRTLDITFPINQYIIQNYDSYVSPTFTINIINKNNITLELHRNSKVVEILDSNFNLKYIKKEKGEIVIYSINTTGFLDNQEYFGINLNLKDISKSYEKYMLIYNYDQEEKEEKEEYEFNTHNKTKQRINNSILFEFEFDNIKILGNNLNDNNITFIVYSYLYLNDDIDEEKFNILNSLIPNSIQPISESKVIVDSKAKKYKIIFNDTLNDEEEHNFIIQIKVFINKNNDYFYNKYLFYTFKEKLKKKRNINYLAIIFIAMIIIIIVILVLIFVIYNKMKKKNLNLQAIIDTSFQEDEKKKEEEEANYSYI